MLRDVPERSFGSPDVIDLASTGSPFCVTVPWKLTFEADRDALIYLNGKFVGRYATEGPQKEFYLPGPYFASAGENTLTFVLAYTDKPSHLRALRVGPYEEFSARRSRVEFQW